MARTIALATLVAGTLDILFAAILSTIFGKGPATMLRGVASGPFPDAGEWGPAGSALGLLTHFTLMAIMATAFVFLARARPWLVEMPYRAGLAYGLITYVIMNLLVVPLRFGNWPPTPRGIVTQLFAHIVLVGIPIALITARTRRTRAFA
jgi:hypothetical protein